MSSEIYENAEEQKTVRVRKEPNMIFLISVILTLAITAWGIFSSTSLGAVADSLFAAVTINFGWLYLMVVAFFVFFCIYLVFSKYGSIVLGPDDCKPEFSTLSWFAMLFSAGMGIGLIFYSCVEPMSHFVSPIDGIVGQTEEAAVFAMKTSFLHWGLHPWASFAVMGLGMAYFQYRKNKPALVSTLFIPLLGENRVNGPIGQAIDIMAVIATVAGVGTSLGLGTMQINGGLSFLFGVPETTTTWLIIIIVIAAIYLWTAVSGVDKGIQLIGNINLYMATGLMILGLIVGPTLFILNVMSGGLGAYINDFFYDGLRLNIFDSNNWVINWRVFYWAWWIAWCPFVGTFIARISKGRTIREFITGVMIVPTVVGVIWFSIFGGMGLNLVNTIGGDGVAVISSSLNTALFEVFSHYPLGFILSIIAVCLVCTFFVTSANSATYVLGMLCEKGVLNPSKKSLFVWGVLEAGLAYTLMLSGGIKALQTASIAAAFPFIFVMLAGCVSIMKALKEEVQLKEEVELKEEVQQSAS